MFVKYVRDPIFGYIGMTDAEKEIVDTFPVQRLRRIKQLSVADITYPGANHSRFSHSLGTMHLAGKMVGSLRSGVDISDEDWQLVRLAGLLHDIGHGPFSHSYEEVLSNYRNLTHENLGRRVIKESELADKISDQGFDPQEVVELIFGDFKEGKKFLKQVITSQIDSDKMDFLLRDSYFTGVEYGQIDVHRLIQAMNVVEGNISVDMKALYAIEAFMIARYEMFLAVYYHHSVRAAEIMLHMAMDLVHEPLRLVDFEDIKDFLRLDDSYVLSGLRGLDPSKFEGDERRRAEKAKKITENLDRRKLLKPAYRQDVHIKDEYVAKLLSDESVRRRREEELAEKAEVNPADVILDVPTLASMPYYPREIDPMEVSIFKVSEGKKELSSLTDHSRLVNVLKGYVDLIRVYTLPKYRKKVGKAAQEVFKSLPLGARVSM